MNLFYLIGLSVLFIQFLSGCGVNEETKIEATNVGYRNFLGGIDPLPPSNVSTFTLPQPGKSDPFKDKIATWEDYLFWNGVGTYKVSEEGKLTYISDFVPTIVDKFGALGSTVKGEERTYFDIDLSGAYPKIKAGQFATVGNNYLFTGDGGNRRLAVLSKYPTYFLNKNQPQEVDKIFDATNIKNLQEISKHSDMCTFEDIKTTQGLNAVNQMISYSQNTSYPQLMNGGIYKSGFPMWVGTSQSPFFLRYLGHTIFYPHSPDGEVAYVATRDFDLNVDITPTRIFDAASCQKYHGVLQGSYYAQGTDPYGSFGRIALPEVVGKRLYLRLGTGGFSYYDISNPRTPKLLWNIGRDARNYIQSVVTTENAFAINYQSLDEDTFPQSTYTALYNILSSGTPQQIAINYGIALYASKRHFYFQDKDDLVIANIGDLTKHTRYSNFFSPVDIYYTARLGNTYRVEANRAQSKFHLPGLRVVYSPARTKGYGSLSEEVVVNEFSLVNDQVEGMHAFGKNLLALVLASKKTSILDLNDPSKKNILGTLPMNIPVTSGKSIVVGDATRLFVTDGDKTIYILSADGNSLPVLKATYNASARITGIHLFPTSIVLNKSNNELESLTIQNPTKPYVVGLVKWNSSEGYSAGNYVFSTSGLEYKVQRDGSLLRTNECSQNVRNQSRCMKTFSHGVLATNQFGELAVNFKTKYEPKTQIPMAGGDMSLSAALDVLGMPLIDEVNKLRLDIPLELQGLTTNIVAADPHQVVNIGVKNSNSNGLIISTLISLPIDGSDVNAGVKTHLSFSASGPSYYYARILRANGKLYAEIMKSQNGLLGSLAIKEIPEFQFSKIDLEFMATRDGVLSLALKSSKPYYTTPWLLTLSVVDDSPLPSGEVCISIDNTRSSNSSFISLGSLRVFDTTLENSRPPVTQDNTAISKEVYCRLFATFTATNSLVADENVSTPIFAGNVVNVFLGIGGYAKSATYSGASSPINLTDFSLPMNSFANIIPLGKLSPTQLGSFRYTAQVKGETESASCSFDLKVVEPDLKGEVRYSRSGIFGNLINENFIVQLWIADPKGYRRRMLGAPISAPLIGERVQSFKALKGDQLLISATTAQPFYCWKQDPITKNWYQTNSTNIDGINMCSVELTSGSTTLTSR